MTLFGRCLSLPRYFISSRTFTLPNRCFQDKEIPEPSMLSFSNPSRSVPASATFFLCIFQLSGKVPFMITITRTISIDERELEFHFIRSAGPGGQNVNKVSTAVQLRFDVGNSPSLPGDVRTRLIRLAGRRVTQDGILIIEARQFRTQEAGTRSTPSRARSRPRPASRSRP